MSVHGIAAVMVTTVGAVSRGDPMLIDCDTCAVRGHGCADCVMTVLLGAPPAGVELDATEQAAIGALAEHGLVPPLRLVPVGGPTVEDRRGDTLRLGCATATG